MDNMQYWASVEDHEELLDSLQERSREYYDDVEQLGLLDVWERIYRAYYGGRTGDNFYNSPIFEGTRLYREGKKGEKTGVKINHFRNILKHVHQLVTGQPMAFAPQSANTDYKSQAQVRLARGLIDYYEREKKFNRIYADATEIAILYGDATVYTPWNANAGEQYTVDNKGNPIFEGDQEYSIHGPMDVIREAASRKQDSDWVIIREVKNRWDLVAEHPDFEEEILSCPMVDTSSDREPSFSLRGGKNPRADDLIYHYTLLHKKTPAVPDGRIVKYIDGAVLFDGEMVYDSFPAKRVVADNLLDTPYGYSVSFDLLPIQQGLDRLNSIIMSNNSTFGIPNIWTPGTDNIQVNMLAGGMRHIKSEVKPEAVQLTSTAKETYNYKDILSKDMETLSGVSSTVRGQPETSLKSGAALALVVSQSLQYISGLEDSVFRLAEDVNTGLIENLKTFSQTERVANIVGEADRPYLKEFSPEEDLSEIKRVQVERVNPLSKTVAGRAEIANNLLQQGLIENPKQYITVLTSGKLEPVTDPLESQQLNITAENEALRRGEAVQVVITENHVDHINAHKAVLEDPETKKDPNVVALITRHIEDHLAAWQSMPPALAFATKQAPPPPPPSPGGAPNTTQPVLNGEETPLNKQASRTRQAQMPEMPENADPNSKAAYAKLNETPI
jgi:hypothetical protein